MSVETSWIEADYILHTRFQGNIPIDDIMENHRQYLEMTAHIEHTVYSILDVSEMISFPKQINQYGEVVPLFYDKSASKFMIIVGASTIARFLINIITTAGGIECQIVNNMDDARSTIKRLRQVQG